MSVENVNKVLEKIMREKYRPSVSAIKMIKLIGTKLWRDALNDGTMSLQCNDDKTFDIVIGTDLIDRSIVRLNETLQERGYCLTLKGKKFVNKSYKDGSFFYRAMKEITTKGEQPNV